MKKFKYKIIDSTNNEAKRLIKDKQIEKEFIVISKEQTGGRGRLGKSFYSPNSGSIYISFSFNPPKVIDINEITVLISKAVYDAINTFYKKYRSEFNLSELKIKPINDLLLGKKKICGILTESIDPFGVGKQTKVIIGIGLNINLNENDIPDDLKEIITSLKIKKSKIRKFRKTLIENVISFYKSL